MARVDDWLSSLRKVLSRSSLIDGVYAPSDVQLPSTVAPLLREVRQYETVPAPLPSECLIQQMPSGVYDTIRVIWTRPQILTVAGDVVQYPRVCVRVWEGRLDGLAEGLFEGVLDNTQFVSVSRRYRLVAVIPPEQQEQIGVCFGGSVQVNLPPTIIPFFVSLAVDGDALTGLTPGADNTTMAVTVITERLRG